MASEIERIAAAARGVVRIPPPPTAGRDIPWGVFDESTESIMARARRLRSEAFHELLFSPIGRGFKRLLDRERRRRAVIDSRT